MIRTQIQLTEIQAERLKRLASASGESIAELIRQSVDLFLENRTGKRDERVLLRQRAKLKAGQFYSDVPDLSRHHDQYLVDAFSDGRYQDREEE